MIAGTGIIIMLTKLHEIRRRQGFLVAKDGALTHSAIYSCRAAVFNLYALFSVVHRV